MPDTADPVADEKKKPAPPRDAAREAVETVVFVVVLVLLLKLFVTEAFVIPTGSMAETLYGYQKIVKCPKCEHEFPVNSHDEVEGRDGRRTPLVGYCCPNCRYRGRIDDLKPVPQNNTGDRVLVLKPLYHVREPQRGDVVVFKFPKAPQEKYTAQNYIKRAMGFGGETVGIYRGDLFVTRSLDYPADATDENGQPLYPRPADPNNLWEDRYMYSTVNQSNPLATNLFEASRGAGFPDGREGGFKMVRKGEAQLLADLRVVWDNDRQPVELAGKVPPRWYAAPAPGANPNQPAAVAWTGDNKDQPKVFGHERADLDWIRYRHLARPWGEMVAGDEFPGAVEPEGLAKQIPTHVDNFLGYNAGMSPDAAGRMGVRDSQGADRLWVGDLVVECKATLTAGAEVVLELSRGVNRFQATFAEGKVTLSRTGPDPAETPFGTPTRPCKVSAGGTHTLRFGNVDARLWVWVDGRRIDFGTEADYQLPTPEQEAAFKDADGKPDVNPEGWTKTNDVDAPAGIGAKGKVTVQAIKLHRDVFYTRRGNASPTQGSLYYVQPGHYLCLGDNSAHSSDSRDWGTVPERLMLGKAVFVFWPGWPFEHSRIGFIK
ncbi:signal peptidase i : Peptidase S24 and S26 domain protein OS=Planctomyces limnophilus (strain ATCC 43296 / DSM 3776 / IFAM 1008 / 290) GN=Plim_1125 PE=3 SV=1: Peptidase_S24 [Gemmataceae bacterium]|nr:signal peptidase i : Peptidase S24 and S26 domain protein OS=Planctomyces limnophilus (strain ATCC 43296 / DSM 3776 / IFAM 1008 / 290) GN=Plim_1125 PE=3 SV=1: Peptidase_S24 [Gemmataceae bacterium]VTT99476.1 signal peptidase i : Peptidase S24 and S26 domain protein OS=Planctomyces limnophilus (strain ATCC 43296 / DSM 3776 / IFAM 1008 / 290) GN=Plim_1125 PE=3 SV=1: Peptidase_S24 [Gemmataceae bacterium]